MKMILYSTFHFPYISLENLLILSVSESDSEDSEEISEEIVTATTESELAITESEITATKRKSLREIKTLKFT